MNNYKEWILTDYIIKNYIGGIKLAQDYKFRKDVKHSIPYIIYRLKRILRRN